MVRKLPENINDIEGAMIEPAAMTLHAIRDVEVFECENPDDNKFIECAIANRAKLIVSGDKHLLKLNGYQEMGVYKPRDREDGNGPFLKKRSLMK
jgi:predicted nucleic acid-binding protein